MGWVVNATPRPLYPRERPGTHCIESWVWPQGRSGQARKISPPPPVFDPRTVQLVASRSTYWAILARWEQVLCKEQPVTWPQTGNWKWSWKLVTCNHSVYFSEGARIPVNHTDKTRRYHRRRVHTSRYKLNNMITNQMYVKHVNFIYYVRLATCFDTYRIIIRPSIESSH